jgi:hypothetical protein
MRVNIRLNTPHDVTLKSDCFENDNKINFQLCYPVFNISDIVVQAAVKNSD